MAPAAAILVSLVSALALSQLMRAALSVVAPDIMADAGLTAEEYAALAGAFFLGIAAAQVPTGVLLDRYGPRVTIAAMQAVAAVATAAFAWADGFWALTAARFFTGVGFAAAFMGGLVVAARWFAPDRFSQVTGLFVGLSQGVGLLLAATPMAALSGWLGWRAAFLAFAAVTLASAAAVWAVVRDAPPGHPWFDRKPEALGDVVRGFRRVLALKGLPLVMLMAMVGYPTMIALLGVWGGPYLKDVHGLDGIARGNVLSALIVGGVTGLFAYGALERLFDTRKYVVIAGALLAAGVLAALALVPRPPVWLVVTLFAAYGVTGSYYITNITLGRGLYPDHMVGRGVTTVNLATFVGVALVQFATGLLMGALGGGAASPEGAYRALFGGLAAFALVMALAYLGMTDIKPSAERDRAARARK